MSGRNPLTPWAGLFLGALAWFGQQQIASATIYWDCELGAPLLSVGLGVVAAAIAVGGGLVSWRTHRKLRTAPAGPPQARSVAGVIGAGSACVFLLAILFQSLAGVIVPACHR